MFLVRKGSASEASFFLLKTVFLVRKGSVSELTSQKRLLLASFFSIINLRVLKLPQTIGLMILAIILSIFVLIVGTISPAFLEAATSLTTSFDFSVLLIDVMLPTICRSD